MFTKDDLISVYTREDAISDGVLIDVSDMAKEAGFKFPVAVTQKLWEDYIIPPNNLGQDEKGRLWDILFLAAFIIKRKNISGDHFLYQVGFDMSGRICNSTAISNCSLWLPRLLYS